MRAGVVAWVLLLLSGWPFPSSAADINIWKEVLGGWWDEFDREKELPCGPERNLHQKVFSADGKTVTWKFQRELDAATGHPKGTTEYTYTVITVSDAHLRLKIRDAPASFDKEFPDTWDLVMVERGAFRWKAADWPIGAFNTVVGVRCKR